MKQSPRVQGGLLRRQKEAARNDTEIHYFNNKYPKMTTTPASTASA